MRQRRRALLQPSAVRHRHPSPADLTRPAIDLVPGPPSARRPAHAVVAQPRDPARRAVVINLRSVAREAIQKFLIGEVAARGSPRACRRLASLKCSVPHSPRPARSPGPAPPRQRVPNSADRHRPGTETVAEGQGAQLRSVRSSLSARRQIGSVIVLPCPRRSPSVMLLTGKAPRLTLTRWARAIRPKSQLVRPRC